MKRIIFYLFCILIIKIISSCTLLGFIYDVSNTVDTVNSRDKDNDIIGNVQIYVENKTNEIIIVYAKVEKTIKNKDEDEIIKIDLARIPKGKIQKINIKKGREIFIMGGNSQIKYLETICNSDQETFVIY
jgi:hypothetical protein